MSRMIPLRRSDRRAVKSPFLAAISASSRSSSCSSLTWPFADATGARLLPFPAEEGCEVARRVDAVFAAAVDAFGDFERACGTSLPLLDLDASPIGAQNGTPN